MCLASIDINAVTDGPYISKIAREAAAELRKRELPAIGARIDLCASVIDELLAERLELLKRVELAEGQARVNGETVVTQADEIHKLERQVRV